ncbi:zinc finger protein 782-like isoform X6 [Plodia interpunctella]|uniref:zinc finger protein 782-like isoform X6 n=1 Tax=Plodia interpunctella TaxID=58824 RepID=UPI00236886EA|nr:zinc finger protein 782-like isoform X6 [Plodia interpunctella]
MHHKMPQMSICRMCLGTDLRMITIAGTPLQAVYEKVTEAELLDNMKPVVACYICLAQLKRCRTFMEKSVKADEVLNGILMNSKLTIKSVARIDRNAYKLNHPLSIKVIPSEDQEELDVRKVKKELEFEFAGADVSHVEINFDQQTDYPQLNEPIVNIDEKFGQPVVAQVLDVGFLKEEGKEEPAVSDTDDFRDAVSDDDVPLRPAVKKRKRNSDGEVKPKKVKVEGAKKASAKRTGKQKRIRLIKKRKTDDQEHTQVRTIIFKRLRACRICQTKFSTEDELQAHLKEHRPYVCDICQKRFRTNPLLKQHLIIHSGEKPFQCYECGTQFSRPHHLRNHFRTHTGELPYECEVCHRRFNNSSNLRQHIKRHTGEKPYQCDVCQRKFAQKNTLQKHLRTHAPGRCNDLQNTREKPYKCAECGAGFVRIYHLKRHLTIHTGEKPFDCSVCYRKFNRKSTLTTHLKTHTIEPKPYDFI